MEFEDKVHKAMQDANINIDGKINWSDRDFQRFRPTNRGGRKKPFFVIVFGDGVAFGDWREPGSWHTVWEKSFAELSREEREERKLQSEILIYQKQLIKNHAIWRAQEMLNHKTWLGDTCKPASLYHPYVIKKRINPHYADQIRSYLVLRVTDVERNLQSLQYIKTNGFKQFKKNAAPKHGMMYLADEINPGDIIRICEGYATGCTILDAVGSPVIVSFGASNIHSVAVALRIKFPFNQIHICADDDQWLKDNVGMIHGLAAAKAVGGKILWPDFAGLDVSSKPTDWNDLFCLGGMDIVKKQLLQLK